MLRTYNVSELPQIARTQSQTSTTPRHPHYIKLCRDIATLKLCGGEKLMSCRKIAESLKISKSCVNSHMEELVSNGWLRRCVNGYAWRSVTYNITLSRQEAESFLQYLASLPTKKKKPRMSNAYRQLDIGTKFGHWGGGG